MRLPTHFAIHFYIIDKADWFKFHTETENMVVNINLDNTDPLIIYDDFYNNLISIRDKCVPKVVKTSPNIMKKPVPWWDDE